MLYSVLKHFLPMHFSSPSHTSNSLNRASMADWSDLPRELLDEILTRLDSPFDALRFRAVCSTWRQSSPSKLKSNGPQTPFSLPSHGISLSKRSIVVLSPSETPISELPDNDYPNSWVIKIEEKNPNFFHIFFPLSWTQIDPLPEDFPRVMDLSNIRIRGLGCEYFLRYTDKICFRGNFLNLLIEKVAIIPGINDDDFFLLTIHVSGKLALYNSVNNTWHIIPDKIDVPYDDIIAFNGEFYAVDYTGRIVLVGCDDVDNTAILLATSFGGGDKKRLVEVGDELMLVDVYMGLPPWEFAHDMENFDGYVTSRSKWFKVYRLDRKKMRWIEVKDLGNYILFLGMHSGFSASAADLLCHKGNCIYFCFPHDIYPSHFDKDDVFKFHSGGVYNLEDASITYTDLFWPPPPWIA